MEKDNRIRDCVGPTWQLNFGKEEACAKDLAALYIL
jgi:hypothetical protein